jgi:hypothetical protein
MSERQRLPNRRSLEITDFKFRGQDYTLAAGYFPDGRLAEVFIDGVKQSTDVADDARDIGVCLSLFCQFGGETEALRSAVNRNLDGSPAGLAGCILDIIAGVRNGKES